MPPNILFVPVILKSVLRTLAQVLLGEEVPKKANFLEGPPLTEAGFSVAQTAFAAVLPPRFPVPRGVCFP